ncbi:hypothetical protein FHX12_000430 [Rhizobium sp. BK609]|nr:hypothetical protein [Rhizobium sp. BK098]MBB3613482.1 hypothetical protein [Rhizobium sp. BK609]MBB3679140.1 hypothetical protein [Rhizobium sp. BK612]
MIIGNGNRRTVSQAGYFDRFWGCPGCFRILSIAEIIELHCESCDVAVAPAEMTKIRSFSEAAGHEALP